MKARVLTFRKRICPSSTICEKWWAILGRLDEMQISPLSDMSLKDIKGQNNAVYKKNSESLYHYAIYLIEREKEDPDQAKDSELWDTNQKYISITRVHFAHTIDLEFQFNKLISRFHKLMPQHSNVIWRAYNSIELSDLILISASDNFNDLTKWAFEATNCKLVGKSYTYFSISSTLLNKEQKELEKNEKGRESGDSKEYEDCIDHLSMRFSAKKDSNAHVVKEKLQAIAKYLNSSNIEGPFRIAGNDDAIIYGKAVPVNNIINLYRKWYQDGLIILDFFSDIITRIGATVDATEDDSEKVPNYLQLQVICESLFKKIDACKKIVEPSEKEWRRPLVSLSNALVHMSRTATLDESVYLILPGLYAFWKNIESGRLSDKNGAIYGRFVELCVHTMEHIMRAERQLSQYPEMRPIAYDIPVFSLEYATAFLQKFNKELLDKEKGTDKNKRKTNFLLVPCAENNVVTTEIFQATKELPGLLQVTIPFSLLYDSKLLIPSLCHELAHYVGENCRLRSERYELYLDAVANEFIRYFFVPIEGETQSLHDDLQEYIGEQVANWFEECNAEDVPLLEIARTVDWVGDNLIVTENYLKYIREYLLKGNHEPNFYCPSQGMLQDKLKHFKQRNSDLRMLFRETFADICMLFFLKLSVQDYLSTTFQTVDDVSCLRALICLKISHGKSNVDIVAKIIECINHLDASEKDKARKKITSWNQKILDGSAYSECCIIEYIQRCWDEFNDVYSQQETENSDLPAIELYQNFTGAFKFSEILKSIDEGRQETLKSLYNELELDSRNSLLGGSNNSSSPRSTIVP